MYITFCLILRTESACKIRFTFIFMLTFCFLCLLSFSFRKLLFLDSIDSYCSKDNWPGENERGVIYQLMTEAGLMRTLFNGMMRELPLPPSDAQALQFY